MSRQRTDDLRSNLAGGVSLKPGGGPFQAAGNLDGAYVDCNKLAGPVQAVCLTGDSTGGPTAMSVNFEIWEADDTAGTGAQKCPGQTEATLTGSNAIDVARALRTKRYCRVRVINADSSFTGGSSPKVPVAAAIVGTRQTVGNGFGFGGGVGYASGSGGGA